MKIDFISRINKLWNLSFSFRTYKKMFPVATILSAIVLWPFLLLSLLLSGFYYVYAFILKIASVPVDFLSNVMHSEGKEVKHATQAVVYIVAFPVIFFMYIMISFFTISLVMLYFAISLSNYIWTIKGFALKPFVLEGECEELPEGRVTIKETIKTGVFAAVINSLYSLATVLLIVGGIFFAFEELNVAGIALMISGGSLFGFGNLSSLVLYLAGISVKGLTAPIVEETKEEKQEESAPVIQEETPAAEEIVEETPAAEETVEEAPIVEETKTPKEKPEFLKRTKIKRNKLGERLNLIGIIGGGVALLPVVIALLFTFLERGFKTSSFENLCVWDQFLYGEAVHSADGTFGLSCVINAIIAFVLVLGVSLAVLLLSLLLKPKTNKATLIRNLIIFGIIAGLTGFTGGVVNICAIESVQTGLLELSFYILSSSVYVVELVVTWKIVETILGFFNVLKIYDRDEDQVLEENESQEPAE